VSQSYQAGQLRKLLPHWVEHTADHAGEISLWRSRLEGQLNEAVVEQLRVAEAMMLAARQALVMAGEALMEAPGGADTEHGHTHSHDHAHPHDHEGEHTHDHEHPGHGYHSHHHHHR